MLCILCFFLIFFVSEEHNDYRCILEINYISMFMESEHYLFFLILTSDQRTWPSQNNYYCRNISPQIVINFFVPTDNT